MRRALPLLLVFAFGGLTGWAARSGRERSADRPPLAPDARITVVRPTGRAVPNGDVDGKPQAEMDSVRLRVHRAFRTDNRPTDHAPPPDGKAPWTLTFGEAPNQTVVVAVPE